MKFTFLAKKKKYISYNEAEEKRDAILLEFAKIDFNMLKSLRNKVVI